MPPGINIQIQVSPRVCLLTLSTVRALCGGTTEQIKRDLNSGKFGWVFDFSLSHNAPDARSKALRFWVGDLSEEHHAKERSLDEVVGLILPRLRLSFPCEDLSVRFSLNRVSVFKLRKCWRCGEGAIKREVLTDFLKSRWLGESRRSTQPHRHDNVEERPVDFQDPRT